MTNGSSERVDSGRGIVTQFAAAFPPLPFCISHHPTWPFANEGGCVPHEPIVEAIHLITPKTPRLPINDRLIYKAHPRGTERRLQTNKPAFLQEKAQFAFQNPMLLVLIHFATTYVDGINHFDRDIVLVC